MRRRPVTCLVAGVGLVVGLGGLAGCGGDAAGDSAGDRTVTVLAAASLSETFSALARTFEQRHPGTRVRLSLAASSELATQVVQGAPADVFASASPETMAQVVGAGHARGRPTVFARNRLAIAVPAGNEAGVRELADLARPDLKVALCAPEVPCGASAEALFDAAGLIPAPDTLEADVKATLSKVTLGEVDAALVYRTDVLAAGQVVEGIAVPGAAAVANDYPIVALADAPTPSAARQFVALVLSPEGRRVLGRAGFDLP